MTTPGQDCSKIAPVCPNPVQILASVCFARKKSAVAHKQKAWTSFLSIHRKFTTNNFYVLTCYGSAPTKSHFDERSKSIVWIELNINARQNISWFFLKKKKVMDLLVFSITGKRFLFQVWIRGCISFSGFLTVFLLVIKQKEKNRGCRMLSHYLLNLHA